MADLESMRVGENLGEPARGAAGVDAGVAPKRIRGGRFSGGVHGNDADGAIAAPAIQGGDEDSGESLGG